MALDLPACDYIEVNWEKKNVTSFVYSNCLKFSGYTIETISGDIRYEGTLGYDIVGIPKNYNDELNSLENGILLYYSVNAGKINRYLFAGVSIVATMKAQWLDSGAGRADVTGHLTANTSGTATLLGTDCWGVDTVASYSFRSGQSPVGDPAACLF